MVAKVAIVTDTAVCIPQEQAASQFDGAELSITKAVPLQSTLGK
ncbi:hypothetical protein ES703_65891 [subsurface metagenome]